jgi:hypothetical protein
LTDLCAQEPTLIAFVKTFGTTFGLLAAALAWLLNRFLAWCVWEGGRFLERYELMKAVHAEINDTQRGEEHYADVDQGREFIHRLKQAIPADAPLVPYVAVDQRQLAFDDGLKQIRLLPTDLIEAVVGYYSASGGLGRQLEDFRSETFRSIPAIGKRRSYSTPIGWARWSRTWRKRRESGSKAR